VKVIQYIAAGLVGALVAGVAVYRLAPRVEVVERVREVRVTVPAEPVPGVTPEDVARLTNEKAALQTRRCC
jgi:glycerol uptake facilitator-like aquaporin